MKAKERVEIRRRVREALERLPDASGKEIARLVGCSPALVSRVRKGLVNGTAHIATNLERKMERSQEIERLLRENPEESSDAIAKRVGAAPSTVQHIRRRIDVGKSEIATRRAAGTARKVSTFIHGNVAGVARGLQVLLQTSHRNPSQLDVAIESATDGDRLGWLATLDELSRAAGAVKRRLKEAS